MRSSLFQLLTINCFALIFFCSCASMSVDLTTGVEFATKQHFELTNAYQDILSLTVTAPSSGYVVLTGSGYFKLLYKGGTGWAGVSIGTTSGAANTENETSIEIPAGSVVGDYTMPFSLNCVIPVVAGDNNFYMVGIKDPNPHTIYANFMKLIAVFVPKRL